LLVHEICRVFRQGHPDLFRVQCRLAEGEGGATACGRSLLDRVRIRAEAGPLPRLAGRRWPAACRAVRSRERGRRTRSADRRKARGRASAGRLSLRQCAARPSLGALAFLLASYRFDRYRAAEKRQVLLAAPEGIDSKRIEQAAEAIAFGRDLINTPANELGPDALERAAVGLAEKYGATIEVTRGDKLITRNLPLIHAVGRAAGEAPRLVDFAHGDPKAPKVTLVGKGVTFDTGGLDIKPASAMELMKKDMGGAASALALAQMILDAELNLRLRVLIPIVENSISATSFRPGDVLKARNGLTVEIGNTDAEGRLILADALALADEEAPDLMLDFATLTGAARVALGPDLPPFYADDEELAAGIADHAKRVHDPVWRLPLWRPYASLLDGKISDLNSAPGTPFAGSIIAALFLKRFVVKTKSWAHFDVYAWNPKPRPHGPEGGELQAVRALFSLIEARYGEAAPVVRRKAKAK
jgi:leucyl aminopeptidase